MTKQVQSPIISVKGAQCRWAETALIPVDAQGYTLKVADNFFEPLSSCTQTEIQSGDGVEFGRNGQRGKIRALHSSSALACNFFDYWRGRDTSSLASALGLQDLICSIRFEAKFPTGIGPRSPNLDVLLVTRSGPRVAIESKFLEPYGKTKKTMLLQDKYFPEDKKVWAVVGLSRCQDLAAKCRGGQSHFVHLDVAQLLKHLLGLAAAKEDISLLYVWFDVGGAIGQAHREEIEAFSKVVSGDSVAFAAISYQQLFARLEAAAGETHAAYIAYLRKRYIGSAAA